MTDPSRGDGLDAGAPHFVVDPLPSPGPYRLSGPEGRHAATVRRLRVGEQVVLTDGHGGLAGGRVTGTGRAEIDLLVDRIRRIPAPSLRVTLVQALPKGERSDLVVELATEAGVDAIVPFAAQRCVARWDADRSVRGVARWTATARESAKQARRPWVPTVAPLADLAAVRRLVSEADLALALHESSARPLAEVMLDAPRSGELVLVVGPEGGLSPQEVGDLAAAGAHAVRLGPEVLRTSTAAAVALGALGVLTDRWAAHG